MILQGVRFLRTYCPKTSEGSRGFMLQESAGRMLVAVWGVGFSISCAQ